MPTSFAHTADLSHTDTVQLENQLRVPQSLLGRGIARRLHGGWLDKRCVCVRLQRTCSLRSSLTTYTSCAPTSLCALLSPSRTPRSTHAYRTRYVRIRDRSEAGHAYVHGSTGADLGFKQLACGDDFADETKTCMRRTPQALQAPTRLASMAA
jgi:hypothetical protein